MSLKKKISQLNSASALTGAEMFELVQSGVTKKGLVSQILTYLNIDTDGALTANSDDKIATQKATKTYVDTSVGNLESEILAQLEDHMVFSGEIDCSANPDYPLAVVGDLYVVSDAGKIGGGSGLDVVQGDLIICKTDSALSGDQATVGSKFLVIPSGNRISTDADLSGNSDAVTPSEKAVKTFVESGAITLTNKRINPRVVSIASSATPTINVDTTDIAEITALTHDITSVSISGTPVNQQPLIFQATASGASRAVDLGSTNFFNMGEGITFTIPSGKIATVAALYNSVNSKFGVVSVRIQP